MVKNPSDYSPLIENLRPIRLRLQTPLASIFRDTGRSESERNFATALLTDYGGDNRPCWSNSSWSPSRSRMCPSSPSSPRGGRAQTLPLFQAEIARKLTCLWNDPPLDPSWSTLDAILTAKIESAQGMLAEQLAFCQTMALDEFLTTAEAIRPSGYRPVRFRPYAEGRRLRVWRSGPVMGVLGGSLRSVRRRHPTDRRAESQGGLPSGRGRRLPGWGGGRASPPPASPPCGRRTGSDDDARMVVASSVAELTKVQEQLKNAGLVPLTLHAWRQADDKLSYSGVWHKTATGTSDTASFQNGLSEADLPSVLAQQAGSLIDLDLTAAPPPPSTKERAASVLQAAAGRPQGEAG